MTELEIQLDSQAEAPMFRQLYLALRAAILKGDLPPGHRLLPSRTLAERLGISRTTVTQAYGQLLAEGFTESLVGSGTQVCRRLPGEMTPPLSARRLSRRGQTFQEERLLYEKSHFHAEAFCPATIDAHNFPFEAWGRCLARAWRKQGRSLIGYAGPAGYEPLCRAVRDYLKERRQLQCSWEQVMIVAGAQQGLDLCARVLTDEGDHVGLEDPGYLGARLAFRAAGAHCAPISVDEHGLSVAEAAARTEPLRVVYVSPSHQFPTGVSMTLARRLALLDFAQRRDCWIVEDDYDSEFRYSGHPLASLKSLDESDRVIYLGSFSKVLHPSLRVGYMVIPPDLVTAFHGAKAGADRHTNIPLQAALTDFLECQEFGRHLRRMRDIYGERREALVEQLDMRFGDSLELSSCEAGLHLAAWLPPGVDDWQVHLRCRQQQLEVNSFTQYALAPGRRGGLVLGFSGVGRPEIVAGCCRLEQALGPLPSGLVGPGSQFLQPGGN